jgi:hypothetical protein
VALFELTDLGSTELKGFGEKVRAWQVVRSGCFRCVSIRPLRKAGAAPNYPEKPRRPPTRQEVNAGRANQNGSAAQACLKV